MAVKVPAGEGQMMTCSTGLSFVTDGTLPMRFLPGGSEVMTMNPSQTSYYCDLFTNKFMKSNNIFMERRCSGKYGLADWRYQWDNDNLQWRPLVFDLAEGDSGVPLGRRPTGVTVSQWWSPAELGYLIRTSGAF